MQFGTSSKCRWNSDALNSLEIIRRTPTRSQRKANNFVWVSSWNHGKTQQMILIKTQFSEWISIQLRFWLFGGLFALLRVEYSFRYLAPKLIQRASDTCTPLRISSVYIVPLRQVNLNNRIFYVNSNWRKWLGIQHNSNISNTHDFTHESVVFEFVGNCKQCEKLFDFQSRFSSKYPDGVAQNSTRRVSPRANQESSLKVAAFMTTKPRAVAYDMNFPCGFASLAHKQIRLHFN